MKSHSITLGVLALGWLLLGAHHLLSISRQLAALQVLDPELPTTPTPWLLALALFFALTYLPWLVYCVGERRVAEAEAAGHSNPVPLALITLLAGLGWQIVLFPQPPRAAAPSVTYIRRGPCCRRSLSVWQLSP